MKIKFLLPSLLAAALMLLPRSAWTANLVVSNTNDTGAGSLRQAISISTSGDSITFATNLSGTTILLTSGQLILNNNLAIDASALTNGIQINGSAKSRIFNVADSNATVVLTSLILTNGYATNGGGIYNVGTLTLNQCTLTKNQAISVNTLVGDGGGIYSAGTLALNQCTLTGNVATDSPNSTSDGDDLGGGIYGSGTMTLNQCTITGNFAYYGGGGIYSIYSAVNPSLVMTQCTLSNNNTSGQGGGIFISGTRTTLNQCTLAANFAGSEGGGICNNSAYTTLNQCTLATNLAASGGGGIFNPAMMTLNGCTLTGNVAGQPPTGNGGGIFDSSFFGGTFINSIVAGNHGGNGPDIDCVDDTLLGANIVQSFFGSFSGPAPNTNAPLLAPLGNYGGPTLTMPPLPGSPAVDGCTNGTSFTNNGVVFPTLTNDQRGFPRPLGLAPDIGAVEGIYAAKGPGRLTGMTRLGNGSTQFKFTNYTDTYSIVLASTNVALPITTWTNLGPAMESPVGSGNFQFTDPQATNIPQRFYRVRSP
jgi:Chlamydia polymorphic membrane protein (Chlamydia_PMP) repeat